jgi:hypothetical protein
MDSEIILELVRIQNQFRFLHWQTKSYAKHIAYGEFYSTLDGLIDKYTETCMGKHGRPDFNGEFSLSFCSSDEVDFLSAPYSHGTGNAPFA